MAAVFGTWIRCYAQDCRNQPTHEQRYADQVEDPSRATLDTFYACGDCVNEIPRDADLLVHTFTCYPERAIVGRVASKGGVTVKLDCGHWRPSRIVRCPLTHEAPR